MRPFHIFFFLLFYTSSSAQTDSIDFSMYSIELDSLVVTASKKGFDVDDFIDMVKTDESFFQAFRNIRFLSYKSENDIQMFNQSRKVKADYHSNIQQTSDGDCRTMETLSNSSSGNFYKRKKSLRYYTAKMHHRLFFTNGTVCESRREKTERPRGMDKHILELKKLIFSPGRKADVPIIGNKTAIFDKKMAEYYNFSISQKKYKSEIDCYVFTANVKHHKDPSKTIIKHLESYFDKKTFQVIARNYHLKYNGALFDFDVKMKIKLTKVGDKYVPEIIEYNGKWDVPTKKPEISKFKIRFFDFS